MLELAVTGGTKNPVAVVLVVAFIVIVGIVVLVSIVNQHRGK